MNTHRNTHRKQFHRSVRSMELFFLFFFYIFYILIVFYFIICLPSTSLWGFYSLICIDLSQNSFSLIHMPQAKYTEKTHILPHTNKHTHTHLNTHTHARTYTRKWIQFTKIINVINNLVYQLCITKPFTFLLSPWYNRTRWLGVKHQLTYLLTILSCNIVNITLYLSTSNISFKQRLKKCIWVRSY